MVNFSKKGAISLTNSVEYLKEDIINTINFKKKDCDRINQNTNSNVVITNDEYLYEYEGVKKPFINKIVKNSYDVFENNLRKDFSIYYQYMKRLFNINIIKFKKDDTEKVSYSLTERKRLFYLLYKYFGDDLIDFFNYPEFKNGEITLKEYVNNEYNKNNKFMAQIRNNSLLKGKHIVYKNDRKFRMFDLLDRYSVMFNNYIDRIKLLNSYDVSNTDKEFYSLIFNDHQNRFNKKLEFIKYNYLIQKSNNNEDINGIDIERLKDFTAIKRLMNQCNIHTGKKYSYIMFDEMYEQYLSKKDDGIFLSSFDSKHSASYVTNS